MGQIAVFSGPGRRRWSDEERLQLLTEAFSSGACVAEVCRRHDVSTALVYTWRRKLRAASIDEVAASVPEQGFVEAVMVEADGTVRSGQHPAIIIDLARGRRVSIFPSASPAQVTAAVKALR